MTSPGTILPETVIGSLTLIPTLTVLQTNGIDRKGLYPLFWGEQQEKEAGNMGQLNLEKL